MKAIILIQARCSSARLPGKVLLPIGPMTAVEHVYARAQATGHYTGVALAHTDTVMIEWAKGHPSIVWKAPKGPIESDVLGRFTDIVNTVGVTDGDIIVRLTADCPLVPSDLIATMIERCHAESDAYVSNTMDRTWPRGCDVEAMPCGMLRAAHAQATDPYDREHVTPWIQRHCRVVQVTRPENQSRHRWTLDTIDDYRWFLRIAAAMDVRPPHPRVDDLLAYLDDHPDLVHLDAPATR